MTDSVRRRLGVLGLVVLLVGGHAPAADRAPAPAAGTASGPSTRVADAMIEKAAAELKAAQQQRGATGYAPDVMPLGLRLAYLRVKRGNLKAMLDVANRPGASSEEAALARMRAYAVMGDPANMAKEIQAVTSGSFSDATKARSTLGAVARVYAAVGDFEGVRQIVDRPEVAVFRRDLLQDSAVVAAWGGHAADSQRLFAEAEEQLARATLGKKGEDFFTHERVFARVVEARVLAGDIPGARALAERMTEPRNRLLAARKVVEGELKAGNRAGAGQFAAAAVAAATAGAEAAPDSFPVFGQLIELAQSQCAGGDKEGARGTLARAKELFLKEGKETTSTAAELAAAYGVAGDEKTARALADRLLAAAKAIKEPRDRNAAVFRAAPCFAALGDLAATQAAMKLYQPGRASSQDREREIAERQVVLNFIASGNYRAAEQFTASLSSFDKSMLRAETGVGAAKAGDYATALKIVKEQSAASATPGWLVTEVARQYAKANRANEVAGIVRDLPPYLRAQGYLGAAEGLLEGQELPAAARFVPILIGS